MTDLRQLYDTRIDGVREEWAFDLAELPDDQAGIALLIESGDLTFVVLASRDDSGNVLDVEMRCFHREADVGSSAWTLRASD